MTEHTLSCDWVRWEHVDDGCYWWWWNGDEDSCPVPVFVMWSGTSGTWFASNGQHGWTEAQNLSDMDGWWMRIVEPKTPKVS